MGFLSFLFGEQKNAESKTPKATTQELWECAQEYSVRRLALMTCVNIIANAIGNCEFKTFVNNVEIRSDEYYLWNVEPNTNQNSSEFIHKLIWKLLTDNEALVITTKRMGVEMLCVADSWDRPEEYPAKEQEYTGVTVGEVAYRKTFRESEVLHFKTNNRDTAAVVQQVAAAYSRLMRLAEKEFEWGAGAHLKVHVEEIAAGADGWEQDFQRMISAQVKPWFDSAYSVLPEFDGYKYEDMGKGSVSQHNTRDIKAMVDDIFALTARGMGIPPVLVLGDVAGASDANQRWMTTCIDPLCAQLQEEIVRKRYGLEEWKKGNYLQIDTTSVLHFDMFANAAAVEKLIGSGAYSINDVLAATGSPRLPEKWADKHYMTLNIGTMEAMEGGEKSG